MRDFATLGKRKVVLGMIHLQPLPGTLFYKDGSFNQTLDTAVQSARALYDGGADGAFVGTCLERGGWGGQIEVERVKAYLFIERGPARKGSA